MRRRDDSSDEWKGTYKGRSLYSTWWKDILALDNYAPVNFFSRGCRILVGNGFETPFGTCGGRRREFVKNYFLFFFIFQFYRMFQWHQWEDGVLTFGFGRISTFPIAFVRNRIWNLSTLVSYLCCNGTSQCVQVQNHIGLLSWQLLLFPTVQPLFFRLDVHQLLFPPLWRIWLAGRLTMTGSFQCLIVIISSMQCISLTALWKETIMHSNLFGKWMFQWRWRLLLGGASLIEFQLGSRWRLEVS